MTAMETLQRRQAVGEELKSIVRVMKSLSAISIKQYDRASGTLHDYHAAVCLGLQAILQHSVFKPGASLAPGAAQLYIVIGSDRGFCGGFNDAVAKRASDRIAAVEHNKNSAYVLTIGMRVAARLQVLKHGRSEFMPVPGAVKAMSETVERVLMWINQRREEVEIGSVIMIHNERTPESLAALREQMILPVTEAWLSELAEKSWPARSLPTFTVDAKEMFSVLIREHLFTSIFRALAESLASEHASRLAAMQRAERHIGEYLEDLGAEIREERQSSITQELLDIVASYGVLKNRDAAAHPRLKHAGSSD
jgi:F-type H+-transporting ATPase subunit gamma